MPKTKLLSIADSKVIDSRTTDNGKAIRRRRECTKTGERFTTFERIQAANLLVEKKDGTTEAYDREKLEKGILISCGKRPVSFNKIQEELNALEEKWGQLKAVKTTVIGESVVEMLKEIDDIAYIRFASVYKKFKDVETFKKEFEQIFLGSK